MIRFLDVLMIPGGTKEKNIDESASPGWKDSSSLDAC